jgi:hypothetical protein
MSSRLKSSNLIKDFWKNLLEAKVTELDRIVKEWQAIELSEKKARFYTEHVFPAIREVVGLIASADFGGRKLRIDQRVLCEVTAVRPDPINKNGWLVDCVLK